MKYFERERILRQHRHTEMLSMFRKSVTKISSMKLKKLHVDVSFNTKGEDLDFSITVIKAPSMDNTCLTIYDFWEIKDSQLLLDAFIKAIKSDNFKTVKGVPTR